MIVGVPGTIGSIVIGSVLGALEIWPGGWFAGVGAPICILAGLIGMGLEGGGSTPPMSGDS